MAGVADAGLLAVVVSAAAARAALGGGLARSEGEARGGTRGEEQQ